MGLHPSSSRGGVGGGVVLSNWFMFVDQKSMLIFPSVHEGTEVGFISVSGGGMGVKVKSL